MICRRSLIICASSSMPLISGLEFGHEQRTVTLPLGARARW
jgi:muramoyltetrapeptide carboxypeptidase LdcA involved in peptidoglycan recycling